jgi:hypothetical protein
LTAKIRNGALQLLLCVILEFVMKDLVESILNTYQSMCPLDAARAADSRQKITRYIETLASAGQRDAEQLTIYGLAQNCTRGKILDSPGSKLDPRERPRGLLLCRLYLDIVALAARKNLCRRLIVRCR